MRRVMGAAVLAAVMVMGPAAAQAGEPHKHDGFFLRMAPGIGYSSAESDTFGKFDGASGSFELAIGAAVAHDFVIHATFDGWALIDEQGPLNGPGIPVPVAGDPHHDHHHSNHTGMGMWGAGVTKYFGPSNVYVTGSVGAARLYYSIHWDDYGNDYGGEDHSDTGIAFSGGVGKEWWVGDSWGLGVSGTFGYQSIPPRGAGGNYTGPTFAVRFSATLN
jgi:hypothetical protein